MCIKLILTISYTLVFVGSIGMMFFATRFPFSTAIKELKFAKERFLCLNGYQVWQYSWLVIIIGTIGQLVALWLPSFIVLLKILLKTR